MKRLLEELETCWRLWDRLGVEGESAAEMCKFELVLKSGNEFVLLRDLCSFCSSLRSVFATSSFIFSKDARSWIVLSLMPRCVVLCLRQARFVSIATTIGEHTATNFAMACVAISSTSCGRGGS